MTDGRHSNGSPNYLNFGGHVVMDEITEPVPNETWERLLPRVKCAVCGDNRRGSLVLTEITTDIDTEEGREMVCQTCLDTLFGCSFLDRTREMQVTRDYQNQTVDIEVEVMPSQEEVDRSFYEGEPVLSDREYRQRFEREATS
jgi:hypothetical protein